MTDINTLGERIKFARELRGWSQCKLSMIVGVRNQYYITKYETGKKIPTIKTLEKIAERLRVNKGWLLFGLGSPEDQQINVFSGRSSDIDIQIKTYRKNKGITQKDLAALTNVSLPAIRCYETKRYFPTVHNLLKLATGMGKDPRWLLWGYTPPA